MTPFRFADVPDQSGKTVFVTGANTGIGFEIARYLAGKSARVVLGSRNRERGEEAASRIRSEHPAAAVEPFSCAIACEPVRRSPIASMTRIAAGSKGRPLACRSCRL